jgi:hypothetical protein
VADPGRKEGQSEYEPIGQEAVFAVQGPAALRLWKSLTTGPVVPLRMSLLDWEPGAPQLVACWTSHQRLELRIPSDGPWIELLAGRLRRLDSGPAPAFEHQLRLLMTRLDEWSYTDSDAGDGLEELAAEIKTLEDKAPRSLREHLRQAREALDDGLPAEMVTAALYRALEATAR